MEGFHLSIMGHPLFIQTVKIDILNFSLFLLYKSFIIDPLQCTNRIRRLFNHFKYCDRTMKKRNRKIRTSADCRKKNPDRRRYPNKRKHILAEDYIKTHPFARITAIASKSNVACSTLRAYLVLLESALPARPRIPHTIYEAHKFARVAHAKSS